MSRPLAAAFAAALLLAGPAAAQPRGDVDALIEALALPELLSIMQLEGIGYGEEMRANLLEGRGGKAWGATVAAIYDAGRMEAKVRDSLAADLDTAEIAAIVGFFGSPTGQEIIAHEIAARRALLDDDAEAAAREAWLALEAEGGPRWALLSEFAELNDLVESNVAGAMTANYAFYSGLSEGGALGQDLSEEQILTDVWSQEQEIREDTVDWVFSFATLAYQPLSEDQFRAYVDFAGTSAGQAMNTALFTAFNDLFSGISRELGRGAARVLAGQDI